MTRTGAFNAMLASLRKLRASSTPRHYVVFDKMDKVIHRGPWTKKECLEWMARARTVFPRPEGVDEVWDIRKLAK